MTKYTFTGEEKPYTNPFGQTFTVKRIVSLEDFADVKAGDIGGWIQSETNLSQVGHCWVYDESVVGEDARVTNNASVRGMSYIGGVSVVRDDASVDGNCSVSGSSVIEQNASVSSNAVVVNSSVREECKVTENASVYDSLIEERAKIMGSAQVSGTEVRGCARVMAKCTMTPIQFSGTIKDVTIADDEMCCGCVSMKFSDWVTLAASPKEDFVASLMLTNNEFSEVRERFTEDQASEIYTILRRSLGFLGRIAQVYGRDVSGFEYIDSGYKLIVDPEMTDPVDTQNKIDPQHFFE